jgi:allantoinase
LDSIEGLLQSGVFGIKAFLCHSGLDEFPNASLQDLRRAAPVLKRFGRPLLVHAELANVSAPRPPATRSYIEYMASRPTQWEAEAIDALISLCRDTRCRIHIVHLANADMLPAIRAAKAAGLPLTVETCPHYLYFSSTDVPEGATQYKCAPPFRNLSHQQRLWDGVRQGLIDTIGSDHSPCPPTMKQLDSGDFMSAWGGIASLQLTLPVTWTEAVKQGIAIDTLFVRLSTTPASIFALHSKKGRIAIGCDADLVVWSPEKSWTVQGSKLFHRHKLTPYDGAMLKGSVSRTYLRGTLVYSNDVLHGQPGGQLLAA